MITVHRNVASWRRERERLRERSARVGFVPTMGALHEGHASLVRAGVAAGDTVLASIFVNPTQFNDKWDYENYPKTWEADLEILERAGCAHVFAPEASELYADGSRFVVTENVDSRLLEGAHRPGHFDGVLTVVLKLLLIADADHAYFGEKDWQQLQLVRDLAAAFFLPVRIVPCATVREPDGLAMSSRNRRLSSDERALAPLIHRALVTCPDCASAERLLAEAGFRVDYVAERWGRRLAAAHLGKTRLIDNVPVS